MGRFTHAGRVRIYHVDSIEDMRSPTVAEITGGRNFTAFLPFAGIGLVSGHNMAAASMMSAGRQSSHPASRTLQGTLTFVLDFSGDNPFDFFHNGRSGYLVRSIHGWTGEGGEPGHGDRCAVYRAVAGESFPSRPAPGEFATHEVPFGFDEWTLDAVVRLTYSRYPTDDLYPSDDLYPVAT